MFCFPFLGEKPQQRTWFKNGYCHWEWLVVEAVRVVVEKDDKEVSRRASQS